MAKTVLNLKLHYKGKVLDMVRDGRDFKNKWFIGTNKFLQWQILDKSFPDKHLFLNSKDNQFYLNLTNGAQISCQKDGKPVDKAVLQSQKVLSGNELVLQPDMTGMITLTPDWAVSYEYIEPYIPILTPEQKQIIAQYARRPGLDSVQRFNRNFIVLVTLITSIFVIVYHYAFNVEKFEEQTVEKFVQQAKADLVQVEFEATESSAARSRRQAEVAEETAPIAGPVTPGGQGTATRSSADILGNIPSTPGAGTPGGNPEAGKLVRGMRDIVAPGSGGGGGGSGPGGTKAPGRPGSSYTSGPPSTGRVSGEFSTGELAAGVKLRPNTGGATELYTGRLDDIIVSSSRPATKPPEVSQAQASYQNAGVSKISESQIASAPAEDQDDLKRISGRTRNNKNQLETAYRQHSAVSRMYGTLEVTLYITESGRVQTADINILFGQFTQDFVDVVRSIVLGWSFSGVKEKRIYTFTQPFRA